MEAIRAPELVCDSDVESNDELPDTVHLKKTKKKPLECSASGNEPNSKSWIADMLEEKVLNSLRNACEKSTTKKLPPLSKQIEPEMNDIECIEAGTAAFLAHHPQEAVSYFSKALAHIDQGFTYNQEQKTLLKYTFASALLESGTYEALTQSTALFEEIASSSFPQAYYGLGRCYTKLFRFKKALEALYQGRDEINCETFSNLFHWPESSVVMEESDYKKLKVLFDELIVFCRKPPRPDAMCCYDLCENLRDLKKEIYYADPDFKGVVRIKCKQRCCLHYHVVCWKCQREEVHKSNDKDILGSRCFTPDCKGPVIEVIYINSKGNVSKTTNVSKSDDGGKSKSKKTKLEKKPAKKKKKKAAALAISQATTTEENVLETVQTGPTPLVQREPVSSGSSTVQRDLFAGSTVVRRISPPVASATKTDPTKVNLEHMLVHKKSSDEQSWQKVDRHRDKKKDKKKSVKTLSIDEFLADQRNDLGFMDIEYQQYVSQLYQYHVRHSMELSSCDLDAFEVHRSLIDFITINGPVSIDNVHLLNVVGNLSVECQEAVLSAGGIEPFILNCSAFRLIDGNIYLSHEASNFVTEFELRLNRANIPTNCFTENKIENKLDELDAFDIDEETSLDPTCGTMLCNDDANVEVEFDAKSDVLEQNIDSDSTSVSRCDSSSSASVMSEPVLFGASGGGDNSHQLLYTWSEPLVATGETASKSRPTVIPKHSKYLEFFQRFIRFIPMISDNSQKRFLHLLLTMITEENVLQLYKDKHGLNIDVEGLNRSFRSIAVVLGAQCESSVQTDVCESDRTLVEELEKEKAERAKLEAQLSECRVLVETLAESQSEFEAQIRVWNSERQDLVEQVKKLNAELQSVKDGYPNNEIQKQLDMEQRPSSGVTASNNELEVPATVDNKSFLNIVSMSQPTAISQSLPSVTLPSLKSAAREIVSDNRLITNDPAIVRASSSTSIALSSSSSVAKMESSSFDSLKSSTSMTTRKNCFERVMGHLRTKFPSYSREEMQKYIQQLRTNRNNSLTGLTIDAIVMEVSKLISDERQQFQRRRSVHNITFKNMSSMGSPSTQMMASASALEKVNDDLAWSKCFAENLEWDFKESDKLEMCSICHEDMNDDVCVLQCHHCFHDKCIRDWLQHQSTCPICRVLSLPLDEFPNLS